MEIYTIELSEDQWNIVMEGLGELPLKRSLPVFEEINNQYIQQKGRKAAAESKGEANNA